MASSDCPDLRAISANPRCSGANLVPGISSSMPSTSFIAGARMPGETIGMGCRRRPVP